MKKSDIAACYDIPEDAVWELDNDLPGYRLETVYPSGRIGAYQPDKTTPEAICWQTADPLSSPFMRRQMPAFHDLPCSCGHRIVRTKRELSLFAVEVAKSQSAGSMSLFLNNAFEDAHGQGTGLALVECSAPAGALITHRYLPDAELPGTIRTDQLELRERIYLPRYIGSRNQRPFADRIRAYYDDVRVTVTNQDGLEFVNSLNRDLGQSGEQRHESGEWGLYGAAGVLFTSGISSQRRYLITKRSNRLPTHPGQWGIPGGARDEKETTLQAATREVDEELDMPSLAGGSIIGATEFHRPGGWTYTTYLVHIDEPVDVEVDHLEHTDAQWVTTSELKAMAAKGQLVKPFAQKLTELFSLRRTWENYLRNPQGLTNSGWKL